LLHCPDKYLKAPGGAIVKFDPAAARMEKLGIVLPHVYIQALALGRTTRDTLLHVFAPGSISLRSISAPAK